jgi:eight-cysteine-cluster-containing protein
MKPEIAAESRPVAFSQTIVLTKPTRRIAMISRNHPSNVILPGLLVLALLLLSPRLSPLIGASSPTLLISEVLYDPLGTEPNEEWIEIFNNASSPVELTDWTISDNMSTDVISPTVTIPVGGCIVIAVSEDFYASYPDFTGAIVFIADGKIGNGLGNAGDRLILKDDEGTVIDQMSYGTDTTAFDPACLGVAAGHSLERSPANVDTDTAEDWIDQEFPNPGAVTIPIYKVYLPFVVRIISEGFCGWSSYGKCSSDSDCILDGCSAQVCQSKYEEPVRTTCEWRDCYNAKMYGLKCRCIDGRCQWSK